jgi:fructose-bisphosphate aldolase, class II
MQKLSTEQCMWNAIATGNPIPAFNIPYLPMMEPVVAALRDMDSFGLITVARLEWIKFQAGSLKAVYEEYLRVKDERFTRLHLDHVPVIDEDNLRVDFAGVIEEAIRIGYESVMVDGSRLSLDENIQATSVIVRLARAAGVPVEGELGAVFGHEAGPLPSYEELYTSGKGFTDPDDAERFVKATGLNWLSVAVGNVHGAISEVTRHRKKVEARLNIEHLENIHQRVGIPLVLHGGTGIRRECLRDAVRHGIAKINVATAIRQPYEAAIKQSVSAAQSATYEATVRVLRDELQVQGSRGKINPERELLN